MLSSIEKGIRALPVESRSPGGLIVKEGISPDTFDLSDAQLLLDGVFANGEPTRQQYREAVGMLGQTQVLSSIITSVLKDPALLEEVDARSFLHSNGMERINLLSTPKYQLRLHIWWPGKMQGATENPHDHVYNFASQEITGNTAHHFFVPSEEGLRSNKYQITSETATQQPVVTDLGPVPLLRVSPTNGIIMSGGMPPYTMGQNTVHLLERNPYKPAITLNLRGAAVKNLATNYKFPDVDNPDPTIARVNTAESLARVLTILKPQNMRRSFR